ncbi:hypothetical protein [Porphyrobacter sp. AAP60]|uniref:hypothetical protein n=1 Tax=Porphyrobacter sp. AAP60 TaxID=1523423 RepID=UPI0006B90A45|nr:hypothetical protein [Porphyrobacter sp. AAP60]
METGLSSNAMPIVPGFRAVLPLMALLISAPVIAQDDTAATPPADPAATTSPPLDVPPRPRVNVMVTVPRGEINQAQVQECEDRADAGTISGEIVVCRQVGDDGSNSLSESRAAAQKRYAQETMLKGGTRAPEAFGIPNHGNPISFGGVPPPALMIDVEALPQAPAGSDADRISRGLPPLNEERELTEEEERARREAAGIKTATPPRGKKKGS